VFFNDIDGRMQHGRRGLALIFNHYQYDSGLPVGPREGTDVDRDNLKLTLLKLGFDVQASFDVDKA
jgi:hypothetical protein